MHFSSRFLILWTIPTYLFVKIADMLYNVWAQSLTNCELSAWNPGCFLHSCHNPNCVSRYVYNLQIAIAFNAYGKRHQQSIAMPYNAENTTALQADRYEQCRDTLIYDCAGALNLANKPPDTGSPVQTSYKVLLPCFVGSCIVSWDNRKVPWIFLVLSGRSAPVNAWNCFYSERASHLSVPRYLESL